MELNFFREKPEKYNIFPNLTRETFGGYPSYFSASAAGTTKLWGAQVECIGNRRVNNLLDTSENYKSASGSQYITNSYIKHITNSYINGNSIQGTKESICFHRETKGRSI